MKRTRKLSCKGKTPYDSRQAASSALASYARRTVGGIHINAEPYKCGDHWHWGHYRKKKR